MSSKRSLTCKTPLKIIPLALYLLLNTVHTNMLYGPRTSLHYQILPSSSLRGNLGENAMQSCQSGRKSAYNACMFHCGLRASFRSCFVPTNSFGMRLTRYAPARMLWLVRADTPLWLLRIEPESEAVSLFLKRGGGAKSSAVKVPDLRSRCLQILISLQPYKQGLEHLRARHRSEVIE